MVPLDADIARASALVIDGNAGSRSVLVNMLHEAGVVQVSQERRAMDARRTLETRRFDIVICEYSFDGEAVNGQDLMDDLRAAHLLPLSTVVVMTSAEAAYTRVAEAAEAALDAYLIKPHTEEALRQRLRQAREQKRLLADIFDMVERGDALDAAEACQVRFETRGGGWLAAARVGAELWLRLGKPHAAQLMFDAILQRGAVPWARLGIARAQYDAGAVLQARRTLESLLDEQPAYADAYDVMGRVLVDQGLPALALDAMRQATSLTPGSIARQVKHGLLAFYHGAADEAVEALTKAARLGLNSRVYDLQGLVLLAALQFDRGDRRGLAVSHSSIVAARAQHPDSDRLRRFETVIAALKALHERRVGDAVSLVRQCIQEIRAPSFDFEAACNLLTLVARLQKYELRLEGLDHDVDMLAQRFAVSHATCEFLSRAILALPPFERIVRDAYGVICAQSEEAVSHTVNGNPGAAVRLLLGQVETSLNAKLLELALRTMERHRDRIDDVDALASRAQALQRHHASRDARLGLSRASDARSMAATGRG